MNQPLMTTMQPSQLLAPLQDGVLNLRKYFPDWDEVERLREDVAAIERRLAKANPRLLELLGKGTVIRRDEERGRIESRLEEKYSKAL